MIMFESERDFGEGIIVDRPTLMSKTRRLTELTINTLSWVLWFFTLRPLVLLSLWLLGLGAFYVHMFGKGGIRNPEYFAIGAVLIAAILLVVVAWNRYDRLRYGGKYKGRSKGIAENRYMGAFFLLSVENVSRIKEGRRIDVHFADDSSVEFVIGRDRDRIPGFYDPQHLDRHFREVSKKSRAQV